MIFWLLNWLYFSSNFSIDILLDCEINFLSYFPNLVALSINSLTL